MHVAPAGDDATLVDLGEVTAAELHAAAAAMRREPGVLAVVPGHSSLLVIRGEARANAAAPVGAPRLHRLRVLFDGVDLEELLQRVRREELLARIRDLRLTVRYLGFRGGFAYLDGWPAEWAMPRRATSRPVARGSFAVAGGVAGFYPIDTPGGWNVLGRTDADLEYAFVPGDEIVIEPVNALETPAPRPADVLRSQFAELVSAPLVVQIQGRDWSNALRGAPPGGPFDEATADLAWSAVGEEAELFECAMTWPRLRFTRDALVAWCGPELDLGVRTLRAGEELSMGRITGGLRGYLAIGGGAPGSQPAESEVGGPRARRFTGDRLTIQAIRGPHDIGLARVECEVTPQLNRVGIRLRPLQRIDYDVPADLRSCGMQCGTVQLHPDGTLVAMGPDHPVTGGYLQPMTVVSAERWKLAQLMPGERVTLIAQSPS